MGKSFCIFVKKYPECNSGYISLPKDNNQNKIILVNNRNSATKYPCVAHGKGDFADWKSIFEEDGYFKDESDLRPPEFKESIVND